MKTRIFKKMYDLMIFQKWQRKNYSVFNTLHRVVNIGKLCFTYILIMLTSPNYAQTDTLTISKNIDIDEVIVTSKRSPVVYSKLSRIVNSLSEEDINDMPAGNLEDALMHLPGLDIKQRGPEGVQADLSIRGGSFDQNLVMLNGININDPQTGHFALNLPIDFSAVDKIEVLKGSGSRIFGPNAYSGVLNIITRPADTNLIDIRLQGGENGYYKTALNTNFSTGDLRTLLSVSKTASNGYIENTDFDLASIFLQSRYNIESGGIDFQFGYSDKAFGAQGFYTPEYPNQFEENNIIFSSLSLDLKTKRLNFNSSVYWRRHKDRYELFRESENWYQRENGYFIKDDSDTAKFNPGVYESWNYYSGHNYHLTDVYGTKITTDFRSLFGKTSVGFDFRSENIWSNVLGNPMDETLTVNNEPHGSFTKSYTRTVINSYLEHSVYFNDFVLSAGFLGSWSNEFDKSWKIFPGVDLSYNFTKEFKVYASANKSLRLPTFTDLFYEGPSNIGNQDLKPEKVVSYESGLKWNSQKFTAYTALFFSRADDVIAWVDVENNAGKQFKTENLTELEKQGAEFQLRYNFKDVSFLDGTSVNYTYIDQEKNAGAYSSKYSLNYLKHKLILQLKLEPLKNTKVNISARYNDRNGHFLQYNNASNEYLTDKAYSPFWLFNGALEYTLDSWTFSLEATNLFNNNYYDMGNIEMPGRWIKIGMQKKFGF